MSRQWKTVYRSSRKRIMVRPRNHQGQRLRPVSPPQGDFWSWNWLGYILGGVMLLVAAVVAVELIAAFWPFLLFILAIIGITAAMR